MCSLKEIIVKTFNIIINTFNLSKRILGDIMKGLMHLITFFSRLIESVLDALGMAFFVTIWVLSLAYPITWIIDGLILYLVKDNLVYTSIILLIMWVFKFITLSVVIMAYDNMDWYGLDVETFTWRSYRKFGITFLPILAYSVWIIPYNTLGLFNLGIDLKVTVCLSIEFMFWITVEKIQTLLDDTFYIRVLPSVSDFAVSTLIKFTRLVVTIVGLYISITKLSINYLMQASIISLLYESFLNDFLKWRKSVEEFKSDMRL